MVIEKLTHISHIVFDKTGTLTENYTGKIFYEGVSLNEKENAWVMGMAANSTHPISRKLIKEQKGILDLSPLKIRNYKEIKGKGIQGEVDGHQIKIGSLLLMNGDASVASPSSGKNMEGGNVYVSIDGKIKGAFRINNVYRKNISGLITKLADKYKFSVLSGDNEGELESLKNIFPQKTSMLFNQKPEDKLNYINTLQKNGEDVLMLGDGLNDAGALVKSNTGIAVTEDITSFTPASDAILDAKRISDLDRFLQFSQTSRKIIYLSFIISFMYNIIGMGFAVFGKLTPIIAAILMPVSSISVVFFATFAVNTMAKIRKLI